MAGGVTRLALLASPTEAGQSARAALEAHGDWVSPDEADVLVALGGDGWMLQVLHDQLAEGTPKPVFGMNRGTFGFLMNDFREDGLEARIAGAKRFGVTPLRMRVRRADGTEEVHPAINEVSLLRETRQTAKLQILVNGRVAIPELFCDGVLVATPAGSTAYNLSANGPILPLGSALLALTAISPFRPRRWGGAILPDATQVVIRVLDTDKRPVSAVADNQEVRGAAEVEVTLDRDRALTLLFDPEHALDERIAMEQFLA